MTKDTQTFIPVTCRPMRNSQPHPWLRWGARSLFAVGLLLLGYVALIHVQARFYNADADRYVARASMTPSSSRPPVRRLESAVSEGDVLGRLQIPRLGVSAAVLQGTSSRTLRHGLGHIRHTALPGMPGNIAIAGHRDTFFRALKDIREGDEIELTTAEAATEYVVDWARVVGPEDNRILLSESASESALTLVTCYPFYFVGAAPERYVVRAHKRTTTSPEPLPSERSVREPAVTSAPGKTK